MRAAQTPTTATLRPDKENSKDWDTTKNVFIEGDNLEVLKILQKHYHGKIKMIYIDPPYNTGKDFVYPDNYKEGLQTYLEWSKQVNEDGKKLSSNSETEGRYHSNWLNMMYPRLKLARNLLATDGYIFISIGSAEYDNLRKLCNEVFGEQNFVENIIWNKRIPKNDKGIGSIHEYVVVYARSLENAAGLTMEKDGFTEIFALVSKLKRRGTSIESAEKEVRKLYKKNGYDRGITLYNSLNKDYRLWGKINMSWPNANTFGPRYEVLHPVTHRPVKIPDRGWRWTQETFEKAANIVNGEYKDIEVLHDGSFLCGSVWFSKDENMQPSSVGYLDQMDRLLLRSILSYKSDGGIEVERLFEEKGIFSYPKPTSLLRTLIASVEMSDGDIVLDFFAGSATTAQAVMQLNASDGRTRQFIQIQLPEPLEDKAVAGRAGFIDIAEIGRERIRRSANALINERDSSAFINSDFGFRSYTLADTNFTKWRTDSDIDATQLEQHLLNLRESADDNATPDDLLTEILLKQGHSLVEQVRDLDIDGLSYKAVVRVDDEDGEEDTLVLAYLDEHTKPTLAQLREAMEVKPAQFIMLEDAFQGDDELKTNLAQICKTNGIELWTA